MPTILSSIRTPGLVVTSLPGSPTDGQECYFLADATAGVIWHLRYRSASGSSYKWEYLGGSGLFSQVSDDDEIGSVYAAAPHPGPSVSIPLAGEYRVELGCAVYNLLASVQTIYMSPVLSGAPSALDADALSPYVPASGAAGRGNYSRTILKTYTIQTLTTFYKASVGTSGHVYDRWLKVTPVRVG